MLNFQSNNADSLLQYQRGYDRYYLLGLVMGIFLLLGLSVLVLYQLKTRPLPMFTATAPNGKYKGLTPLDEPNLLPETLLQWASKAVTAAYTFDFSSYEKQLGAIRPFFTEEGWISYRSSINALIQSIVQNQLFINGVIVGTPVIASQGDFTGRYIWRIELPFLVTVQSAEKTVQQHEMVVLTLVKIPTYINPTGIGIDQFVMTRQG